MKFSAKTLQFTRIRNPNQFPPNRGTIKLISGVRIVSGEFLDHPVSNHQNSRPVKRRAPGMSQTRAIKQRSPATQVQITDKFHPNRSKCERRVSCSAPEQRRDRRISSLRADAPRRTRPSLFLSVTALRRSLKFRARH